MGSYSDDTAMAAFTKGIKKKELVRSLYLDPAGDFDSAVSRAKDYMLADKGLYSS